MKLKTILFSGAALVAALGMVSTADAQFNLVPNGDFAVADGDSWTSAGSGGTVITWEASGGADGAADGYGQIDNTAGAWGGVLVAEGGTGPAPATSGGIVLGDLGLTAGQSYDFQFDMINLTAGGGTVSGAAGIKIENWSETGIINDSGDQYFDVGDSWTTNTFSGWLIDPTATRLKVVPLLVQSSPSIVGFDNVGVVVNAVPEPSSLCVIALGLAGLVTRRRRS